MLPRAHDVLDAQSEELHLPEQLRQLFVEEGLAACGEDCVAGTRRDEVAQSPFILDNVRASQFVVGLHGGVRVHF